MKLINKSVDGFSTSSLFESRLACEIAGKRDKVHIVSPGLDAREIEEIGKYAKSITFNSMGQAERLMGILKKTKRNYDFGIRVNPKIPLVEDERYNPCHLHSKLGVNVNHLKRNYKTLSGITGLHFHTNCEGVEPLALLETAEEIAEGFPDFLKTLKWVNIGGGYYFHKMKNLSAIYEAIEVFTNLGLRVILEPGGTVVKEAGTLISSVVDILESDGYKVAILDASVNHLPEVFEYQFRPNILEHEESGKFPCILGGPTCLAGDKFGLFKFKKPLKVGDKITFGSVGSYSMVKSHTFNGVNLPSIYSKKIDGKLVLRKKFDYKHYKSRWQ